MQERVCFVGQAPSRKTDAEGVDAFVGRSGEKLAHLSGMSVVEWRARYDRYNLLDRWPGDRFPVRAARFAAAALPILRYDRVVLVGREIAFCFGLGRDAPLLVWSDRLAVPSVVIPHPSGLNRWWNDPENERRARAFLTDLARGGS